jgi:putative oxidoreductase
MFKSDRPYLELAGRILISLIFLVAGFGKVMDWSGTAEHMASKGMIAIPFFLTMAILFELGAGTCVLLGWHTRWAALALIVFLIPATLIFHNFWAMSGMERMNNMQHFLKNLAIMGAMCKLAADGAGRFSLDARRGRTAINLADVRIDADRVLSR